MVRPTEKAKTSIRIRAFFETGKDDTEEALYLYIQKLERCCLVQDRDLTKRGKTRPLVDLYKVIQENR